MKISPPTKVREGNSRVLKDPFIQSSTPTVARTGNPEKAVTAGFTIS